MEPVTTLDARHDGWTVDELDRFPDDGLRYELVDGSLLVSPPATPGHNSAMFELGALLRGALDPAWRVVPGAGVALDRRNYREPDLVVVRREALDRRFVEAADVLLAVEVMSPSSVTDDRLTKPAQYARAGVPHYWRLERGAVPVLVTCTLQGEVYREVGRFTDEVVVERPVGLHFRLEDLLR
jgi:Uma2 family endonuclease